MTNCVCHYK